MDTSTRSQECLYRPELSHSEDRKLMARVVLHNISCTVVFEQMRACFSEDLPGQLGDVVGNGNLAWLGPMIGMAYSGNVCSLVVLSVEGHIETARVVWVKAKVEYLTDNCEGVLRLWSQTVSQLSEDIWM